MRRFPLLATATVHHCVLGPGMLLYIPNGWWHAVRSLSVSLSISFWFDFAAPGSAACS